MALVCLGVIVISVVLVGLILVLDLTVAIGTINGIVFYANIIAANSSLFLPFSQLNIFTVFIAWLNLSIGFDICLYIGLNEYIKAWLLFIFPIYLITLVAAIILFSGYSSKFASIIGKKNPAATLATLILLSYTKCFQTVIKILSFTILKYPDGSQKFVWLSDANVQFLEPKHVPLFLIAVLFTTVGFAYTIILFLWQWIQKIPVTQTTRWIANAKLNSFICTYHLPYQANHRYWTGLLVLLLARVILYLVSAIDVSGDPCVWLLAITLLTSFLLVLKALFGERVYEKKFVDYLNALSIINILGFSLVSFYSLGNSRNQKSAAFISVSVSILIFIAILLYHGNLTIVNATYLKERIKQKIVQRKLEDAPGPTITTSSFGLELYSNYTSSEICLSPTRSKKLHNSKDRKRNCYISNDFRESLLQ